MHRVVMAANRALIGGGGGEYSYIRVLPDEFLLKSTLMTTDFKRNLLGRMRIYEYSPPNQRCSYGPAFNTAFKTLRKKSLRTLRYVVNLYISLCLYDIEHSFVFCKPTLTRIDNNYNNNIYIYIYIQSFSKRLSTQIYLNI